MFRPTFLWTVSLLPSNPLFVNLPFVDSPPVFNLILAYSPDQHPIVLQIGGSNLENLAKATELADAYGYDEINFKYWCSSS
ncbi:tRNA-dihydrouridine(20/20a) synthase [Trifolium repens]|nr:tRNA-dihydrouridine(20/20a) synthase [Trifolium repens]